MKLDTSSLLDSNNSTAFNSEPNNCVTSSNDIVMSRSCRNSNTFIKEPNSCIASSSNVVIGGSHQNSDTFRKVPHCSPSSSEIVSGQIYSPLNMDSLTAQKQIVGHDFDDRNLNLWDNFGPDLNKNVIDSDTDLKEIVKYSRNIGNLVDYTPSSSGSFSDKRSFSDSLNQEHCTYEENGRFSTTATAVDDHPVYSFAVYQEDLESRVQTEKFMYASESAEADSSMDTQIVNDRSEEGGIRFVNTDTENEDKYQEFGHDNFDARKGIDFEKYHKNDRIQSEMDCQSVVDGSECLPPQTENTYFVLEKNVNKLKARHHTNFTIVSAGDCKTVGGVDMESSEIDDPTYTEQLQTESAHFSLRNKASNADIAFLVNDGAICVADNVETINFNDLVDDSAICFVKDETVDNSVVDSDIRVNVNEKFKNASNANIADFVDDSAMHVVAESNDENTHCIMDNSPTQGNKSSESSGMIDIYASSVITGIEETKTKRPNSGSKQNKGQGSSYQYESLQRFVSCPTEFGYEEPNKQIRFQNVLQSVEMPTIADSFTPVKEDIDLHDFLKRGKEQRRQWNKPGGNNVPVVNSLDRAKRDKNAVQDENTPNRRSYTDVHRCRQNNIRRDFLHTNASRLENRPLPAPPMGDLDRQPQGYSRKSPPLLPPKVSKLSPHPYKLVSGGKSSRPMLDQLLANDRLFIHYNSCLQGYPGWSPRETEYTVSCINAFCVRNHLACLLSYMYAVIRDCTKL